MRHLLLIASGCHDPSAPPPPERPEAPLDPATLRRYRTVALLYAP